MDRKEENIKQVDALSLQLWSVVCLTCYRELFVVPQKLFQELAL